VRTFLPQSLLHLNVFSLFNLIPFLPVNGKAVLLPDINRHGLSRL